MARSDTGRWVARAAATGGGRSYRGQRPIKWYSALALIALVGIGTVYYSRYERQHPSAAGQPTVGTKWVAALSFDICGVIEPNLPTNPNLVSATPPGITTQGDGLIHISPERSADAGANATLGRFAESYPGMELTSASVRYPSTSSTAKGATSSKASTKSNTIGKVFRDGEACPKGTPDAGKQGTLQVQVYPSFNAKTAVKIGDPVDYRLGNDQLITIAFLPFGRPIPKPPGTTIVALIDAQQQINTPSSTTLPTSSPTTTAPTTATTSSTPSTTTATTASPTTTAS